MLSRQHHDDRRLSKIEAKCDLILRVLLWFMRRAIREDGRKNMASTLGIKISEPVQKPNGGTHAH